MNVTDWYIWADYIIDRGPMLSFDMRQIRCKLLDPVLPILLLELGRFDVGSFSVSIGKFHFNNTIRHNIHVEIVGREDMTLAVFTVSPETEGLYILDTKEGVEALADF